ncbi:hypothetical protein QF042_004546 [Pedobacter sp. W3I1]|uniref:hypothetical protein n=1 Tax=Pedobacter sp. W3I1 TaxID=3042291 RepID=UPI00277E78A2|nr:hypothetical protein [Pedobacter sp. W3I1]MDQ0640981.1 hypothetical protein [Pedobacter sp. W3I1]
MKTRIKIISIFTGLFSLCAGIAGHAQLSVSYSSAIQSYSTGSAITTLSPNLSGGTASAGGQTTSTFVSSGLYKPLNTAVDASGNVYLADRLNHMVRKISGDTVSTVAGNGSMGSANGYGTSATFQYPNNPAVDASFHGSTYNSNIIISERNNFDTPSAWSYCSYSYQFQNNSRYIIVS